LYKSYIKKDQFYKKNDLIDIEFDSLRENINDDEVKFKSSHENILSSIKLLENKHSKGKLINKKNDDLCHIIDFEKDHYALEEYENKKLLDNEIEEINELKYNSYPANNIMRPELGNEELDFRQKFNSFDISNLWQKFPFRNNSNASKKIIKNKDQNNLEIKNTKLASEYKKQDLKDSDKKDLCNQVNSHFYINKNKSDQMYFNEKSRSNSKFNDSTKDAYHSCNIDILKKYLNKSTLLNTDSQLFENSQCNISNLII